MYVVDYYYGILYVELFLHLLDEVDLIRLNNIFHMFFLEKVCIHVHQWYLPIIPQCCQAFVFCTALKLVCIQHLEVFLLNGDIGGVDEGQVEGRHRKGVGGEEGRKTVVGM